MTTNKKDVQEFYDDFTTAQAKVGVNNRHRFIKRKLKHVGLKPNDNVIEIGCGVGVTTQLISDIVTKGQVLAVDISPKSIDLARERLRRKTNVQFEVLDLTKESPSGVKFSFAVLPDVIEHIPIHLHFNFFQNLRSVLTDNATVFINIPNPLALNYNQKNHPELLQIIDQPISTKELCDSCYPHGFIMEHLENYSLFYKENDATWIVLKTRQSYPKLTPISKWSYVFRKGKLIAENLLGL